MCELKEHDDSHKLKEHVSPHAAKHWGWSRTTNPMSFNFQPTFLEVYQLALFINLILEYLSSEAPANPREAPTSRARSPHQLMSSEAYGMEWEAEHFRTPFLFVCFVLTLAPSRVIYKRKLL